MAGICLAAAALLFWVAWLLMPGVGVTDASRIFELVSAQRAAVAASVAVQLASSALYVPALVGLVSRAETAGLPGVRPAAGVLLLGAMGSAADAVLHLLAYAMTAPGLDSATLLRVMAFMQGPGLLLLAPLMASFFLGSAWLSLALGRAGRVSWWSAGLHGVAVAVAAAGGSMASTGLVSPRSVGLTALAAVAAGQAWAGIALWRGRTRSAPEPAAASSGPRTTPRTDSDELEGGCLCGGVRFRVGGEAENRCYCHCRSCRLASGAPFVAWATFRSDAFRLLRGEPAHYRSSPKVLRGFCPECGSALTYAHEDRPEEVDVALAALDDATGVRPECHIWVSDKLPWVEIADGLPQHAEWRGEG